MRNVFASMLLVASLFAFAGCSHHIGEGIPQHKFVELHLHLDGAVTLDIAKALAEKQNIDFNVLGQQLGKDLSTDEKLQKALTVPADCTSLTEFLECFALPCALMQTKEGLEEAVYLVAENCRKQGVIYAEIRFAPQKHKDKGMSQRDAIEAALAGLKRTSLKANLILCCMRDQNNDAENDETVSLAKEYIVADRGVGGVVAVDIAGAEALYPTSKYSSLFARVKSENIPFTIHAGEVSSSVSADAGKTSVRLAIQYGATRIGHGVATREDPELVDEVKNKGIYLEMCPTSNRQTQAVADMSQYPFMDFLNKGVKVTLNTDDPAIEGTTLADEYRYMENNFGLTAEQERVILSNSVNAAFTTESVKAQLRQELGL